MSTNITLQDSRADGITAAAEWMAAGELEPEHFTNPGADAWGDEGCDIGDAAYRAFHYGRHCAEVEDHKDAWEARGRWGSCPDWEDEHWDAFVEGFTDEARRLAQQRGWNTEVQANG